MAIILKYPEDKAALRKKSKLVRRMDREVWRLIADMKETLAAHPDGVGLAAPQINVHQRVVIVRLGVRSNEDRDPGPPIGLVNPEILEASNECKDYDGCLSFPGLFGRTIRPHHLRVSGWDESGVPFNRIFEGFDAVVVHHEIDHLDGVLFIDRIESMEDLYRILENEHGSVMRVPMSFVI
jgi:peptide deformylase